jgi:hypothetical protein
MVTSRCVIIVLVVVALTAVSRHAARSQDEKPASKVVVDKTKITFDPKTCTGGRGHFYWGFGSSAVKVLGHKDGHCVFEYTAEVEMGHTIYLVRVPVGSGPVTIEVGTVKQGETSYPGVITSFPLDKARVLRRGGAGDH